MRDIASYDCARLANTELRQERKTFFINDSVRGLEFAASLRLRAQARGRPPKGTARVCLRSDGFFHLA